SAASSPSCTRALVSSRCRSIRRSPTASRAHPTSRSPSPARRRPSSACAGPTSRCACRRSCSGRRCRWPAPVGSSSPPTTARVSPLPSGTAAGFGAATEMFTFDGCGGAPGAGLLVRRLESNAPDAAERFYAYSAAGTPAPAGDPLAVLADALTPGEDEIVGQACVDLGDMPVRIVATRGTALGLVAWLVSGTR